MIQELIENIQRHQSPGEPAFRKGHFRANRFYPYLGLRRSDNNLFFTALTLSVLTGVRPDLDPQFRTIVDRMERQALANFPLYQVEREGVRIYQFWPEGRQNHFPNGWILHRFKKFKSPPDVDDTALAYQTFPHTPREAAQLRQYLQQFANGNRKWNRKIPRKLNRPKVYATWMGTGAMPIEFDVVVMSNLLRTFRQFALPANDYDRATQEYLTEVIRTGFYLEEPFISAPWYPFALTIHYHLVKLATSEGEPLPDLWNRVLIRHLQLLEPAAEGFMSKILWNCSALRLGQPIREIAFEEEWESHLRQFTFYIGGMLTALSSRSSWRLAKHPVFHWRFRCEAFNYALLLEYEVLRTKLLGGNFHFLFLLLLPFGGQ